LFGIKGNNDIFDHFIGQRLIVGHSWTFRNFGANRDDGIFLLLGTLQSPFYWSAIDSGTLADIQEYVFPTEIMAFFTSNELLICD
jgi:hypothetical protein